MRRTCENAKKDSTHGSNSHFWSPIEMGGGGLCANHQIEKSYREMDLFLIIY